MYKSTLNLLEYEDVLLILNMYRENGEFPLYNTDKLEKGNELNIYKDISNRRKYFMRRVLKTSKKIIMPEDTFVLILDIELIKKTESYYYFGTCKTQLELYEKIRGREPFTILEIPKKSKLELENGIYDSQFIIKVL